MTLNLSHIHEILKPDEGEGQRGATAPRPGGNNETMEEMDWFKIYGIKIPE